MYLVVAEHPLELILEGEVKGLGGEVTEHVGQVTTPQRAEALLRDDALEAVADALVGLGQTTSLDHLILGNTKWTNGRALSEKMRIQSSGRDMNYLVLDEELDTLNGCGSGLGYRGGDTTHEEIDEEGSHVVLLIGHGGMGGGAV